MKERCQNPASKAYSNYGGRGIQVCEEWQDFIPFWRWAIANSYSDELEIDRIDVNGNYSPENCRWVDDVTQANNRRNTLWITAFGETKRLTDWLTDERCTATEYQVRYRLRHGWKSESALAAPKQINKKPY